MGRDHEFAAIDTNEMHRVLRGQGNSPDRFEAGYLGRTPRVVHAPGPQLPYRESEQPKNKGDPEQFANQLTFSDVHVG
jgi:hypothetical protein